MLHFKTTSELPQINLSKNLDCQKNNSCWQSERACRKQTETLSLSKPSNPIQLFKALSTVRGFHISSDCCRSSQHNLAGMTAASTSIVRNRRCCSFEFREQLDQTRGCDFTLWFKKSFVSTFSACTAVSAALPPLVIYDA